MRRTFLIGVPVLLIVAAAGVGWYYSGRILGPDEEPAFTGQPVLARTDSTITLTATPKALRPGEWAMLWPGGYGRIGPLLSSDSGRVVTRFRLLGGALPGTTSRLSGFAPATDPKVWLGIDFESVEIPSRAGTLPAWLVPGAESTWVVLVHGRAATRAEVLRMLPAYRALGLPCLVLSYRNDPDGPRVGDGGYRLGSTEWRDLEDAVGWARGHGARDVVVVGCSMGGGIVAQFLRKSSERAFTRAAVLDAPALDWSVVISVQGRAEQVPEVVTAWGRWCAGLRGGFRWDDLAQARHAREFSTPMLIFHGAADETVPVRLSREFAAARPDLVTLHVVERAGHVESVNFEPELYGTTIAHWLRARGIGAPS